MASKKQHEQFNKQVAAIVKEFGGVETSSQMYKYSLATKAGNLAITTHDPEASKIFAIYCKFDDPGKAKSVVSADTRLNEYSGKWNFHLWDKEPLLRHFTYCLKQII